MSPSSRDIIPKLGMPGVLIVETMAQVGVGGAETPLINPAPACH